MQIQLNLFGGCINPKVLHVKRLCKIWLHIPLKCSILYKFKPHYNYVKNKHLYIFYYVCFGSGFLFFYQNSNNVNNLWRGRAVVYLRFLLRSSLLRSVFWHILVATANIPIPKRDWRKKNNWSQFNITTPTEI